MTEKLLMINLQDDKSKELAQVISNKTSRKILDLLANKDATETEISEELNIPISTVHYNLEQLKKAKLVIAEEYHYSKKGKEVNHYKLANKYIIIAPKNEPNIWDKLKNLIPAAVLAVGGAGLISYLKKKTVIGGGPAYEAVKTTAVEDAAEVGMREALVHSRDIVKAEPNVAFCFLAGALFVIITILITILIRRKK